MAKSRKVLSTFPLTPTIPREGDGGGAEGLGLCPTHSLHPLGVGLCSGDPALAGGTQGHASSQECTQTAFAACLCMDACVTLRMSANSSRWQFGALLTAVKPRDESLWILTHCASYVNLGFQIHPSSGESFGSIWEQFQGFACSFAWQMNGWGSLQGQAGPYPPGDKLSQDLTRSHPVLLQH